MSLIRGNALAVPLADETVDLIVTSPPYFALRSYTDGGEHYAGQIGSEATPAEFVAALIEVTRECVRVLKPSGSLWVNLGDKYSQRTQTRRSSHQPGMFEGKFEEFSDTWAERAANVVANGTAVREKSLMGLPWRYALGCIDDLGLILRAEVIWSKPNGLPESVQDRVRRSHETWFHFTKEPRYFSAVDEIREPHTATATGRDTEGWRQGPSGMNRGTEVGRTHDDGAPLRDFALSALGKLPGSVWTIPTEPLRVPDHLPQHFAAFPSEWPKRIILGWSPSGVCVECGEGRRPVVESTPMPRNGFDHRKPDAAHGGIGKPAWSGQEVNRHKAAHPDVVTGESCACPTPDAPTRPAIILDPFCGTGTTVAVANALGRHGVGLDLSADYLKLARWRCQDPALRAKVLGVDKPKPETTGQLALMEAM